MNANLTVIKGAGHAVVESGEFGIIGTARKVGHKWEFTSHRTKKVYTFPTLKAAVAHAEEIAAYLKSQQTAQETAPQPVRPVPNYVSEVTAGARDVLLTLDLTPEQRTAVENARYVPNHRGYEVPQEMLSDLTALLRAHYQANRGK